MTVAVPETLPQVSIVIPCYNGETFVREAIDSALAQTYPRVEVVVIDDGSTDRSWEVIRSYGNRIRPVHQKNQGLPATRNVGISRASGDYFLFLDADDIIAEDTVQALVEAAGGAEETIAACSWRYLVFSSGTWQTRPSGVPFPQTQRDPLVAWLHGEWIPGCSLLWPRHLLERLDGYDPTLTADEDGDLMYRALISGAKLVVADGGESFYRRHGSASVSMSYDVFSEHRFRSRMRVFAKLEDELRRSGKWDRYREPLGIAYQSLAQRIFGARPELAREALIRGEELAGRMAISPTLPGRLLVRLFGMDRKERLVSALARLGLMTSGRRALHRHRRMIDDQAAAAETESDP